MAVCFSKCVADERHFRGKFCGKFDVVPERRGRSRVSKSRSSTIRGLSKRWFFFIHSSNHNFMSLYCYKNGNNSYNLHRIILFRNSIKTRKTKKNNPVIPILRAANPIQAQIEINVSINIRDLSLSLSWYNAYFQFVSIICIYKPAFLPPPNSIY